MTKKTWLAQGLPRAAELAEANITDLCKILEWNLANDIRVYRMSSDLFPWMSEYRFEDLPNFITLCETLTKIGTFVQFHGMRLSFHPGQFDVLASPTESVVTKTIYDLDQHSCIMDLMGLPADPSFPINIHVGGSYGDKPSALARFCDNFTKLAPTTRGRLVVENDDKASQYGVVDLYQGIYMKVGCPITFDHFHHTFCTNDLSGEAAATLAATTWHGHTPLQHFSSSKKVHEDSSVVNRSHADYLYEAIPDYGFEFDCEIEAKAKDLALLKYLQNYSIFNPRSLTNIEREVLEETYKQSLKNKPSRTNRL